MGKFTGLFTGQIIACCILVLKLKWTLYLVIEMW